MVVEILEHGPEPDRSPGFLARHGFRLLAGVLAAAVLAVVGTHGSLRSTARPPAPAPSTAVATLVSTGSGYVFRADDTNADFVVLVDLTNFNRVPVRAAAGAPPRATGFARLVVAVMAKRGDTDQPGYDDVAAAATQTLTIGAQGTVWLAVAGRLACGRPPVAPSDLIVTVDGRQTSVQGPDAGAGGWAKQVARNVCRTHPRVGEPVRRATR